MDIERRVHQFIVDSGRWWGPPADLTNDHALIDGGVLDSMAIFELVTFVEDHYDIVVDDDDLVPESFATISAVAALVRRQLPA